MKTDPSRRTALRRRPRWRFGRLFPRRWPFTLFQTLEIIGFTIALIAFLNELSYRDEERTARAWQLLITPSSGNSGKIEALEYLNSTDHMLWPDSLLGAPSAALAAWWPTDLWGKSPPELASEWPAWRLRTSLTGVDLTPPALEKEWEGKEEEAQTIQVDDCPARTYLGGVQLARADLTSARLPCADLKEADLSGADLKRANLSGAVLEGTDLSGVFLFGANLSGVRLWKTDLSSVDLVQANLSGADLKRANLSGADFSVANLSGADLWDTNLSGASLLGTNLSGVYLEKANLSGADLEMTNLSDTWAAGTIFYSTEHGPAKGLTQNQVDGLWRLDDDPLPIGLEQLGLLFPATRVCPAHLKKAFLEAIRERQAKAKAGEANVRIHAPPPGCLKQ